MYLSKYNVIVDLDKFPEQSVLQNLFHGKTCIINRALAQELRDRPKNFGNNALPSDTVALLKGKGFIYETAEDEELLIDKTFNAFKGGLPTANPIRQYQIVLTYDCNLRCVYCFQKDVRKKAKPGHNITHEQIHRIFEVIDECERANQIEIETRNLVSRVPLIQIVGGEPLSDDAAIFELIENIVTFSRGRNYQYSITTNGVHLHSYIDLFNRLDYRPRDTQVTIDGPKALHDRRRIALGGKGSFDDIIGSIDKALDAGLRISLRINVDSMNVDTIPELGDFFEQRGWTNHPEFSAYIAPVTDHSSVNGTYKWMTAPSDLITRVIEIFRAQPKLSSIFTMKNFRGYEYVRRLLEEEGVVTPTMWRCEAVLGQYVFDPLGGLYTCFEGAGKAQARIGTYFPEFRIELDKKQAWDKLNAVENPVCGSCKYRFVCTSGCPLATISEGKTECLPIEAEINLAWNYLGEDVIRSGGASARKKPRTGKQLRYGSGAKI